MWGVLLSEHKLLTKFGALSRRLIREVEPIGDENLGSKRYGMTRKSCASCGELHQQ